MKNKFLIISIVVVILVIIIAIGVWAYKKSNTTETTTAGTNSGTNTNSVASSANALDSQIKAKIEAKKIAIKNYPEFYNSILKDYQSQGWTLNQALTAHAIWALKVDGEIPMDTYGAGEWGANDYVKKNYI